MSLNTFGRLFRVTTFGESHGVAIGCVVDGCPPGLSLTEADIQPFLDLRKPGTSRHVTPRQEGDRVRILSGTFDADGAGPKTTGTPIGLLIENEDARSGDYSDIGDCYRPGHADYTYDAKYGFRDPRGGGRSSARETAMRVAAGAIARKVLGDSVRIFGALEAIGTHGVAPEEIDLQGAATRPLFAASERIIPDWEAALDAARRQGSSLGGIVRVEAHGVPPGWGAPIYGKLDADLAAAMMGINAAKGVEIGGGFEMASRFGHEVADEMLPGPVFSSNFNGGVLGGISTGQALAVRVAIKPTSSIRVPRQSLNRAGEPVEIVTKGRHDPCVAIRGVPVAEAMMALVLVDHKLLHRAQIPG
jgi:chorismate synthase